MKDWLRIDLTEQQVSAGAAQQLQRECFDVYMAHGMPDGAGMHSRKPELPRARQVATEIYLSPALAAMCASLIKPYNPVPVSAPPAEGTHTDLGGDPARRLLA